LCNTTTGSDVSVCHASCGAGAAPSLARIIEALGKDTPMWKRRTKEQIHGAAVRNIKIAIRLSAVFFLLVMWFYYYRFNNNNISHRPTFAILFTSACLALIIVLFSTSVVVFDEWLHLHLFPGPENARGMLCLKCWYVQDYSRNLVCSKCGGPCEDAECWTWIDDVKTATLPKLVSHPRGKGIGKVSDDA
jgi:hypothetical protein